MAQSLTEENLLLKAQLQELAARLEAKEQESAAERDRLSEQLQALQERAESERELYEELMRMQDNLIAALSTPLLPVAERVLVMPLIGSIDEARAARILEVLLTGVTSQRARTVILDVSGIERFHAVNARVLLRASEAIRLLGSELIVTGLTPTHALSLLQLGVDVSRLVTRGELRAGIEHALRRRG